MHKQNHGSLILLKFHLVAHDLCMRAAAFAQILSYQSVYDRHWLTI